MNTKLINLVAALIFALVTVGGFYWLWSQTGNFVVDKTVAADYQPIEIESVKTEAAKLLEGLEKHSDIPISTPTSKMGRTDPYKAP